MFRVCLDERKKREIDPPERHAARVHRWKPKGREKPTNTPSRSCCELAEFFEHHDRLVWPDPPMAHCGALTKFVKAGDKIRKLLIVIGG